MKGMTLNLYLTFVYICFRSAPIKKIVHAFIM